MKYRCEQKRCLRWCYAFIVDATDLEGLALERDLMQTKLFVGGLSWDTNDSSLRNAFARFGAITEATVITDRETGRSRGFGFVTFSDAAAARAAEEGLNGTNLDGRTIKVNKAQERSGGRG